jgi:hypothetical protein
MKKLFVIAALCSAQSICAQDDLLGLVDEPGEEKSKRVFATFKTTHIGNAQSIETVKKQHLDFRISHRFGNIYNDELGINETFQTFFGFDNLQDVRFSLDYGLTDDITLAIGRSQMNRLIDGSMKYRILHQTSDFRIPVSVAFFGSVAYCHDHPQNFYGSFYEVKDFPTNELHRFSYFTQLIVACKVNDILSLEILPSYMHRNFIQEKTNPNNDAADKNGYVTIGFGGRIKLTKRVSFIGDYFYNVADFYRDNQSAFNPLSLGFEIETGGHVFSLFFTNASGLIENNFIPYTTDTWTRGQVKFGFTISRTFAL